MCRVGTVRAPGRGVPPEHTGHMPVASLSTQQPGGEEVRGRGGAGKNRHWTRAASGRAGSGLQRGDLGEGPRTAFTEGTGGLGG